MLFLLNMLISIFVVSNDINHRQIPNVLVIGILIVCAINGWLNGFLLQVIPYSLLIFISLFFLWYMGVIGGGDVKLIVAFSLGVKPIFLILMLCVIGVLGGALLVTMYIWERWKKREPFSQGIPYGIPIVISGCFFSFLSGLNNLFF